jgi:hypothetical protein
MHLDYFVTTEYYLLIAAAFVRTPRDYVAVRMNWYIGAERGQNTNNTDVDYDEIISKTFLKL